MPQSHSSADVGGALSNSGAVEGDCGVGHGPPGTGDNGVAEDLGDSGEEVAEDICFVGEGSERFGL